ncbi:MAG TPA: hypothetical protein VKA70_09995 [Blastocatellia bacterium]|nr:hypothetical protein [Blastocatellia bacterium]
MIINLIQTFSRIGLVTLALLFVWACPPPPNLNSNQSNANQPGASAPRQAGASGDVKFQPPAAWVSEPSTSSMRVAQYRLPRADGDAEDASLILYYFGQGQGGSTQANLDRWIGQMQQPGGGPSKEKAKTEKTTVNGMDVTLLDVSGTYTAEMTPGSGNQQNKPGFRMRAAVIETPKGAYFVKLVGPEKTVARWDAEFMSFVRSFEFK